jgi:hypothetical protein
MHSLLVVAVVAAKMAAVVVAVAHINPSLAMALPLVMQSPSR